MAPLMAGAVLAWLGLQFVLTFDVISFIFSILVLLLVSIPKPVMSEEGRASQGSFMKEMRVGYSYIFHRPGLRGLMLILFGMNALASLTYFSILPAMILARSGKSEWALGVVQSIMGVGGVIGALLLTVWGGPRRRIDSVLLGGAISFLLGDLLFAVGRSVPVWALAAFFSAVFIPFISGSQQSIWQVKVAPDLQGRVFSAKDMLQQIVMPLGFLAGGILADFVFEPAMRTGGTLSAIFGGLVGVGPGAGMGLMFMFTWILGTGFCLSGYLSAPIRNVELELPDVV